MFIRVNNKLVNPAAIATGEIGPVNVRGIRPITFHDRDGKPVATARDVDLDLFETETIIAGPVPAIFIADDGTVTAAPIVAWRIGRSGAEPIFYGDRPHGHMFMSMQGNALLGVGRFPELYPSLKAACAAVAAASANQEEAA
jgi:hypothetical protein